MNDEDISFLLSLILASVIGWYSYHEGKDSMVNELCNMKVYDFCQPSGTNYKLKEFKE